MFPDARILIIALMDFNRFTIISFDCYGTLIDWESGILPTLRRVLSNHDAAIPDADILNPAKLRAILRDLDEGTRRSLGNAP